MPTRWSRTMTHSSTTTTPTTRSVTTTPGSTTTTGRAPNVVVAEVQARLDELARLPEPVTLPGLHLSPIDCGRVEELLGLGSARSVETLLAAVARLGSINVGEIRLPFTPGQLEELKHRAQKRGRTLEAEMKAVVDRIR